MSLKPQTGSASQRPLSSLSYHSSQYGSTSNIASLARPASSASIRPSSSASIRPSSRASYRPKSRQQKLTSAKLLPFCQELVRKIVGVPVEGDDEMEIKCHELVDWSVKQLGLEGGTKAAVTLDMEGIDRMVRGHVEKARVRSQTEVAKALETSFAQLKEHAEREDDLDAEIKKSRLPAHVQLLLSLSSPPQPSTSMYASMYLDAIENPPPPPESAELTWKKILDEDPFEGDHWVGIPGGIPLPRKRRAYHDGDDPLDDIDSSPSLSPLDSDDLAIDDTDSEDDDPPHHSSEAPAPNPPAAPVMYTGSRPLYTTYVYRKELEDLKTRQYWQPDWQIDPDVAVQRRGTFDIGDASTLGPTLQRVLPKPAPTGQLPLELVLSVERYIREQDAVREVLIALQGRRNILYDDQFTTTKNTPRLLHFSLASQKSILNVLGRSCRIAHRLRQFTSAIMSYSTMARSKGRTTFSALDRMRPARVGKMTRTLEAFADAIDAELRTLEVWCSDREEAWLRALGGFTPQSEHGQHDAGLVVSLLGTEKAFRDRFEDSFQVILDVVIHVIGEPQSEEDWVLPTRSPSLTTTLLLDTLFSAVQQRLERGAKVTSDALMRVFVRSAEPVWKMVGKWLGTGFELSNGQSQTQAGGGLEEEFFIESNGLGIEIGVLGLLDPDFWAEGYSLRAGASIGEDDEEESTPARRCIPSFLEHVAAPVLESGKALGLLKTLGVDIRDRDDDEARILRSWDWTSFQTLITTSSGERVPTNADGRALFSISVDRLSRLIYDKLTPYCQTTGALLAKVIVEDCDFWSHSRAIESLYLMRRGDIISDFADVLFGKIDSRQDWTDFHFLNITFSDIVQASNNVSSSDDFIEVPLIRLSYRGANLREKNILKTVKALDGLSLEYAVPFPLTYIFTPANLQIYSDIFVFLLQIRRAKSLLEKILVRGASGSKSGLKALYAMRSRLSWFVNTFLNFITTYVIQTQVLGFHKTLTENRSQSLDQMIKAHDEHLTKMQSRCLLQSKTTALHRAVLSILDMTLNFSDMFSAFAGDATTHDISSHSVVLKHHRSRRQRRRRKNIIGFSYPTDELSDSSDSEVNGDEDGTDYSYSVSMNASTFAESDDSFTRISKMSTELDGLVRFFRRGIESLAGGTNDASATFGVLAFSLEDWDL